MSEFFRDKRVAALTAVVALGALAAGCGSSKSKTSTERAKPARTHSTHVVKTSHAPKPAHHPKPETTTSITTTTPKPETTTASTTTVAQPPEASPGSSHHNSLTNLCNTGVSTLVKSIVGKPDLSCQYAGVENVGQTYWGIDPSTHLPKATVIVATYPPSVAEQIPGYSKVMANGDAVDASIDGVKCTWEADVPNYRCYDGNTIIGAGIFRPAGSLAESRQLMHLVLQATGR